MAAEGRDLLADDDLEREAAVLRHRPGGERGIDALVVGDGDDVERPAAGDVVEDLGHGGGAVRGDRVDVQVGAARPDRGRATAAPRRVGPRSTGRPVIATSSRSGQIGKKTAHHCSGASSMIRSNSAASAVIVPSTRSRRVPASGTCDRREASTIAPDARPPDADDVGRRAALDGEHRRAEREPGRGAEELDRHPAAGQVAVADEPDRGAGTERGEQLAARLAQADDADADRAAGAHEPALERGVVDGLHRRDGAADPAARNSAGSSMAPKWRPMKIIGPPEANASSTTSGVSTIRRSSRSAARMAGVRATSR